MAHRSHTLRARDSDRVATCGLLDTALGDGQLTDDEHRERTAAAMSARTLGELDFLVDDLQVPTRLHADVPAPRRPVPVRAIAVAASALTAVVAAAVVLAGRDDAASEAVAPVAAADAPAAAPAPDDPYADVTPIVVERIDPLTAVGIGKFRDAYLARFGDTLVDNASFHEGYVSVDRMIDGEPYRSQDWSFRGGFDASSSPDTGRDPNLARLDLATLNLDALAGHLAGAADSVHVPGGTISHLIMRTYDGTPEVMIYVENEQGMSGYLTVSPDGTPVDVVYGDR